VHAPDSRPSRGAFGALLLQHRASAGLSQSELGELAGLSSRGISDLERGLRRWPHPATVRRLADALALDADERAAFVAAARHGRTPAARSQPTVVVFVDLAELTESERKLVARLAHERAAHQREAFGRLTPEGSTT
jgi:transcriptional regulator with XRE-family HTH domain